jgi:methylmalonyl-CoA mutase C-terminal domain/subunit
MIAAAALQEDVDAIGLSILSGAHMTLLPAISRQLRDRGVGDIPLFAGGSIPPEDIVALKEQGVLEVFTPGASTDDIIVWAQRTLRARE